MVTAKYTAPGGLGVWKINIGGTSITYFTLDDNKA